MGFNFKAWQAEQDSRRMLRRWELFDALENGQVVMQAGKEWPECSPFLEIFNTPESLAEHIESREYGFGFKTEILEEHDQRAEDESNYQRMIGESLRR